MRRVLFVDDEPAVLEGLRRFLRSRRAQCEMHVASSGVDALAMLESMPFDVVVTDTLMPGIDGAELLVTIRDRYP